MSKALRKWAKFVVPILSKKVLAASVLTAAAVLTGNPALIQAAFSADAALVANSLTPKQKITSAGQETSWKADARAGIPYAVGRCAIAGNQVFQRSAGGSNKFKNFVTVYTAAGPIDAIESYLVNDVATSFTADSGEGATGYYQNRMWLKTQLGATTAPYLHWSATGSKDTPANHGGMPSEWGASQELPGFAASLWALEWDTAKYSAGVPGPKMVARWVKVYDPRKDSTYPGGSGSHRYADPSSKAAHLAAQSTWEWSANPYLHGLMWCLGRWTGDPARSDLPLVKSHGLGAPLSMVEVANFVDAANIAQANGWTLGGQVSSTDDKWEVLKAFLEAGGGEPILLGHKIGCMINAPKISLATIRKADVIGDVSVAATTAIEDRINTIWPSYTEETLNWSVVPFDEPVQVGAYLAPDKGSRSIEMSLPLVQSPVQMAQLARYRIEDSRELTPIVIPAKPWTMWLRPGDCFTADEPEWGLNARKLLILQRKRDPATMTVTFICRTETDGKHAFALGQTATAPDTPALTGLDGNIVPPPAGGAWAIVGGQTAGPDGALPGIVIQGEAELYDAVTVVVDYREVISAGVYGAWQSQSFPASSKTMVVTGVKPGARYQVRLRYITAKGVENPGGNTGLGEVTVGAVNAGTVAGKPAQEVVDDLNLNAEQIAAEILRGALARAYIDALTHLAGVPIGTVLLQEKEQRIDADGAFAALMSLLGAKNGAGTAFILNAASVQVTPTQSLATFLSFIDSTLGDGTVTITELREALNGERGRVALSINNNGHLTGWEIASEGGTGGPITGTLGIVTDQLYMVDPADATGETSTTFLEYVGGQLKVKNLLVEGDLVVEGSLTTPKYAPNSINVPVISTGSAVISCDGTNKLIISHTVDLAYDAAVFVTCFLSSHFPGGDKNWAATLYIDGVSVFDCGGANGEATITMGGSMYCAAGARLVEVRLNSHASVNVTSRTLNTLGPMR